MMIEDQVDMKIADEELDQLEDIKLQFEEETEKEFEETYNFIKALKLSGLHVFSYSLRPLTAAAKLPQLQNAVIKQRADKLRELDQTLRQDFAAAQVDRTLEVLAEKTKNGQTTGTSENFIKVNFKTNAKIGKLAKIKVLSAKNGECFDEI
jgi:threonylcarbamoyladenosine tRNA methylthiotransferase MtaB